MGFAKRVEMIFKIITFISFIITSFIIILCTSNSSSERRFHCGYSLSYFIYDNEDDPNPYKEIEYKNSGIKLKVVNRAYGRKKAEEFEKMLRETYLKEKEINVENYGEFIKGEIYGLSRK